MTKKQLYVAIGATCAVFILAIGATWAVYDVYAKRSDDAFAKAVGAILPAARVGSHVISYDAFLKSRSTLASYLSSDLARQEGMASPLTPDLEKGALDRLVRQEVVSELAEQQHVSVSDADVQSAYQTFVQAAASTTGDVPGVIQQTFHWTEREYQDNVIRPILLEQRVSQTLTTSTDGVDQGNALESYAQERMAKPDVKYYLTF